MGFAGKHLLPDERVVYCARPHWVIFARPIALLVVSLVALIAFDRSAQLRPYWPAAAAPGVLALLLALAPLIRYITSEYLVTNHRVLISVGLIQRQSLETLLSKVETIGVSQNLTGRMLGFGTITVIGTGGTREAFSTLADPFEFRRQVQMQILAREDRLASR